MQVADQRRKKNRQREEEQKYFHNQMVEIEQWKEMEKERDVEMKAKAHKEKQDRDEQLAFDQKRRDEELYAGLYDYPIRGMATEPGKQEGPAADAPPSNGVGDSSMSTAPGLGAGDGATRPSRRTKPSNSRCERVLKPTLRRYNPPHFRSLG